MKRVSSYLLLLVGALCTNIAVAGDTTEIKVQDGEFWWGALTTRGALMPMSVDSPRIDLRVSHEGNQGAPLLLSNRGRYIWSDEPFAFQFIDGTIKIESSLADIELEQVGTTLKDALVGASKSHFPASGVLPNEEFFTLPQYNTWIELIYDQNQADILKYARDIVANGYPTGILMIDDNWQRQYGNYDFRAEKFPDPKGMIDELHQMGFKVMLWISPFVSPDGPEYRDLKSKGYLLTNKSNKRQPAIFNWWNGHSAAYDLSNPDCYAHLLSELRRLQSEYGVDGYKFDAGDAHHYNTCGFVDFNGNSRSYVHTTLWAKLGQEFEFNEYRASWNIAGENLVQRLKDKTYAWEALPSLVTDILNAGVMGYAYTCPDMIGGGEYKCFLNMDYSKIDQDLIVRSCQVHALMPMMQFSVAPWRVLDEQHNAISLHYAELHAEYGDYILELAKESSKSCEPIVRYMEYEFPGEGFESCTDQFMLGSKYLVAPMLSKGYSRTVKLPKGTWRDERGKRYRGGKSYEIDVPIDRLPVFTR